MRSYTIEQSGAFVEKFSLSPTSNGPLAGLTFAVKDIIDVAGRRTGCGNPTWLATHPPAAVSAVCVEQLLAAGARCVGKTVTDEVAFSLLGENHFYGTPLNPAAPDRVPGGSSCGSASAVACGLVDFALGTDTGGSVRVPASNCGIWSWRPSHGLVSVAGVMPFAPTYDTIGVLAKNAEILRRAAGVLLATDAPIDSNSHPMTIHVVSEAVALADNDVRQVIEPLIDRVARILGATIQRTSLGTLCNNPSAADWNTWLETYRVLMANEVGSTLGGWIAEALPTFGPMTAAGIEVVKNRDRTRVGETIGIRESYYRQLGRSLSPRDLLCMPTTPAIAPLRGSIGNDRGGDYYRRTLALNAIAGVVRLPQVSMPLASISSAPIGLSLIAARGEDSFLLAVAERVEKAWSKSSV